MQDITSKDTSVNQLAAYYRKAIQHRYIVEGDYILDYGCGKNYYNTICFAYANSFDVCLYDPYHMSEDSNRATTQHSNMVHVTGITCNNVLNVLKTVDMVKVLLHLQDMAIDYGVTIMFTIYEGDKSGIGRHTKRDCYQRNERISAYVETIHLYFEHVSVKHGIIKAAM